MPIVASVEQMRQWLPEMDCAHLEAWSKMPIWKLKAYSDRRRYLDRPGLPYQTHVFREPVDIVQAVQWWRLRIPDRQKGLCVFEGSFALEGPTEFTEPPRLLADAENQVVEADGLAEIAAKRLRFHSWERMTDRWGKKQLDPVLAEKIQGAERLLLLKKDDNKESYQLGAGWVKKVDFSSRRNEIKRRFG